ncbi:MAG: MFS transporter, partial [Chloroflexi bacterium]|nr:MFS transporter [Chloroflexota bacterium]
MTRSRRRLLVLAMFIDTLGSGLLVPFELVYALRVPHLSLATAGLILSAAAAAGIAAGPVAGAVVDRVGPGRVVALANGLGVGGCVSLVAWTNGWGYGLGALLLSAGQRTFWGAFTPLVATIVEEDRLEQWFGRLRGARYVGLVAGEGLSGVAFVVGQHAGLRLIVVADALSYVAALLLVLLAARGVRGPTPPGAVGAGGGYRAVLADRVNVALAGLNVGATLLVIAPILALPVFVLDDLHLPSWLPGLLAGLTTAVAALGLLFGARLVRGRRRLRNLQIADLLWALALGTFLLAPAGVAVAYCVLVVGAVVLGLGEAYYAPTADALPAALAPPALRGRYAALHQMAWGVSDTVAPTLVAVALSARSDVLWVVLAVLAAACAAA